MANRYWVGGAGNWSDTARWSTSSGGAGGASVPGTSDTAIFDASSDSGTAFTATVDTAFTIASLSISSTDKSITFSTAGNLTVTGTTTISNGASTISLTVNGNASLGDVTLNLGILNINGSSVTMKTITATSATVKEFNFGTNGSVTLTGNAATIWNFNYSISATVISGTGSVYCNYNGATGTRTILNYPSTGEAIPSFYITAGSDTISFTANTNINSLDFTGFSGTWATTTLGLYGNLTLSSTMSFSGANTLSFIATSSKTITTNGKTLDFPITFNGVGGTWTLQDNLTVGATRTTTLTNGTIALGSYTLSTGLFASANDNVRSINFGTGGISLTSSTGTVFDFSTVTTKFSISGTSNVSVIGGGGPSSKTVDTSGISSTATAMNFNFLATSGINNFAGGSYANNIVVNCPSATFTIASTTCYGNFTLTDAASATGTGSGLIMNNTSPATNTISSTKTVAFALEKAGTGTLQLLSNITSSSGQSTLTQGTIDLNGNVLTVNTFNLNNSNTRSIIFGSSNITVTGTGTLWQGANLTGFSYTGTPTVNFTYSGSTAVTIAHGTSGGTEARALDFNFTAGSYAQTNSGVVRNLTYSGTYTGAADLGFSIYGNLTLKSGMTATGAPIFAATSGTKTITSSGISISSPTFNGVGGTWVLQDDLIVSIGTMTLTNGTFNANNFNVSCAVFSSSNTNTRTLTMGSGTWTLSGTATVWDLSTSTNATVNGNTSTILLSNTTTTARTFAGGGKTYNNLTIGGTTGTSTLTISGSNTFNTIASTKTVAHTISLTAGTTQTVSNWTAQGTAGNLVTINSTVAGTQATLTKTGGGYILVDYVLLQDNNATPATTWFAGTNSAGYASNNTPKVTGWNGTTGLLIGAVLTTGSSWTSPTNWNSSNNNIYMIGGGGGGSGSGRTTNTAAGAGGGGGAYVQLNNVTLSNNTAYTIAIGAAGSGANTSATSTGGNGGNTTFNDGTTTYTANGGKGGSIASATPASTGGAGGAAATITGVVVASYKGGDGGSGGTASGTATARGAGGGGGAGGPNGAGGNGGSATNTGSAGGGGNGGGTNGTSVTGTTFGAGGNNFGGTGGGSTSGANGTNGGGGAGANAGSIAGGDGSNGSDLSFIFGTYGSGGGSGGSTSTSNNSTISGLYGGGGGGGGVSSSSGYSGCSGKAGIIIITFNTPATALPATQGNFFLLF